MAYFLCFILKPLSFPRAQLAPTALPPPPPVPSRHGGGGGEGRRQGEASTPEVWAASLLGDLGQVPQLSPLNFLICNREVVPPWGFLWGIQADDVCEVPSEVPGPSLTPSTHLPAQHPQPSGKREVPEVARGKSNPAPNLSLGLSTPQNQAFATHGISLSRASSPGCPEPWAKPLASGRVAHPFVDECWGLTEPVVQTSLRCVLCPGQYWPEARAHCLVTGLQTDPSLGPEHHGTEPPHRVPGKQQGKLQAGLSPWGVYSPPGGQNSTQMLPNHGLQMVYGGGAWLEKAMSQGL